MELSADSNSRNLFKKKRIPKLVFGLFALLTTFVVSSSSSVVHAGCGGADFKYDPTTQALEVFTHSFSMTNSFTFSMSGSDLHIIRDSGYWCEISGSTAYTNNIRLINTSPYRTIVVPSVVLTTLKEIEVKARSIVLETSLSTETSLTFRGPVIIGADIALQTGSGGITFESATIGTTIYSAAINSAATTHHSLELQASGDINFAGPIGATQTLGTLTLKGNATFGSFVSPGEVIVNPGNSPGTHSFANLTLTTTDIVNIELEGLTPGTDHDQIVIRSGGTAILGLATLQVTGLSTNPDGVYTIINNLGSAAIGDTFAGLPQGSTVVINGKTYVISYIGGTGNDVTLTLAIPATTTIPVTTTTIPVTTTTIPVTTTTISTQTTTTNPTPDLPATGNSKSGMEIMGFTLLTSGFLIFVTRRHRLRGRLYE